MNISKDEKDDSPKYSIIVPVYNSERYLEECIDNVLSQSYKNYELLLIDDGSEDQSVNLCDYYSEKYPFIKCFHQKNRGASAARNQGINHSIGKYLIFLDSDDYWDDTNALKQIDESMDDMVDVLIFASKDYDEETETYHSDRYEYPHLMNSLSPLNCLKYMIENDRFNVHPGKRVYRRQFIIDNALLFKEGIRSEDIELGLRVADKLPNYKFLNTKFYIYRHHKNSVTTSIDERHLEEYKTIIENYAIYPFREETREYLLSYVAYQYILLLAHSELVGGTAALAMRNTMKQYRWLLKYTKYPRTKTVSLLYRLTGYFGMCKILGLYLKRIRHYG